ncbi:hypothetical protein, partial [Escherichia sp. MOD1-EC6097]|uniref:hypothetical protein n=1 Tax=Escherichia sp. MOD1-EC6097 TaxID=2093883 RepID=UPI001F3B5C03
IRPTVRARACRPDKTRQRRIRRRRTIAGCGVTALSGLPFGRGLVGLIRRVSVVSGVGAQLPDAA